MQHDEQPMLIDLVTSSRESTPSTVDLVSPLPSPANRADLLQSDSDSSDHLEVSLDTTALSWPEPVDDLMVLIRAHKAEDVGIDIKLHTEIWKRTVSWPDEYKCQLIQKCVDENIADAYKTRKFVDIATGECRVGLLPKQEDWVSYITPGPLDSPWRSRSPTPSLSWRAQESPPTASSSTGTPDLTPSYPEWPPGITEEDLEVQQILQDPVQSPEVITGLITGLSTAEAPGTQRASSSDSVPSLEPAGWRSPSSDWSPSPPATRSQSLSGPSLGNFSLPRTPSTYLVSSSPSPAEPSSAEPSWYRDCSPSPPPSLERYREHYAFVSERHRPGTLLEKTWKRIQLPGDTGQKLYKTTSCPKIGSVSPVEHLEEWLDSEFYRPTSVGHKHWSDIAEYPRDFCINTKIKLPRRLAFRSDIELEHQEVDISHSCPLQSIDCRWCDHHSVQITTRYTVELRVQRPAETSPAKWWPSSVPAILRLPVSENK